ncbi:hypothetical protein AKJ47_02360 [candidate division MSBL1 archaeon SCGC-AAA261G05]|uniref:UPF0215 protein AKJ47_02360 n=1 Tax=candidate division MSBL1 archaeon SCGC-AAA261G05 TaxID=1698276 RepID=A0A133VA95_9EURY|nr:hypothetical protein AKJ47_02360 [candidate division MSBL1 archaeon SCGC-AAA261G05]
MGFDDGSFEPQTEGEAWLIGVVTRGGQWIDGVLSNKIKIDGMDATPTIIDMVNESRHKDQVRVIMTSGITFAGFNVVDTNQVFEETGIPVIVISRKDPDLPAVKRALKNLPNWQERWEILNSAGEIRSVKSVGTKSRETTIYVQTAGIKWEDAEEIIQTTTTRSSIPEPLRLAHLIATGISRGESVGRV